MTEEPQLNLRSRHPDFQTFLDINERESERVRDQYTCVVDQHYGSEHLQTLDIFPASVSNAPILVFIHGGYWKALDKKSYSFVAEPFIKRNYTVFVLNYRLIPSVKMGSVVQDIQAAMTYIIKNASRYSGNPNHITLSGHSAGGHLALLTYLKNDKIRSSVRSICSLSGIFDLSLIKNSYLNEDLKLGDDEVKEYSVTPEDLSILTCPTLLTVGSNETEFFIAESKNLFLKAKEAAKPFISYHEYPQLNHYQIVHQLGKESNTITDFIFEEART